MRKQLYKSGSNRTWSGIIGGIGEYFSVDPALLRVAWILIVVFTGFFPGLIAYLFAAVVVPEKPGSHKQDTE